MSKPRRALSAGALVLALAATTVACSTGGSSTPAEEGDVTIRLSWQTGPENAVNALIAAFEEAHPNIHVDANFLPIDGYGQQVVTEFQAGNGPDVVWGSPGYGNSNALGNLFTQGWLADLSDESFASTVNQDDFPLVYADGQLYGLPLAAFPIGALYNADVLGSTAIPQTFNEFLALCKTFSEQGKSAISLSGASPALFAASLAANYVYNTDPNWNAERDAGKVSFATSKGWRTTMERFMQLYQGGCFPEGVAGMQASDVVGRLFSGQSLLALLPGDASTGISRGNPNVKLGMFPFPGDTKASTSVPISFGQALGVNADSAHLAAAKTFVQFASENPQAQDFAHSMGVPTIAELQAGELPTLLSGLQATVAAGQTSPYAALTFPSADVYSTLGKGFTGLLTGQLTIDQVLKSLDDAWDAAS